MFILLLAWIEVILHGLDSASPNLDPCQVTKVNKYVNQVYSADGVAMEVFPFKIGDYNREVQKNYPGAKGQGMTLQYPNDTIAFVAIYHSKDHTWMDGPAVFEIEGVKIQKHYSGLCFNISSMHLIQANEMHTTVDGLRLPVVHVQTAGHVSGGAFYYQRHHVINEPAHWINKTIYGISIHEDFGLDTVFAGVMVFSELIDPTFTPRQATDVAPTDDERIKLLDEYNTFG